MVFKFDTMVKIVVVWIADLDRVQQIILEKGEKVIEDNKQTLLLGVRFGFARAKAMARPILARFSMLQMSLTIAVTSTSNSSLNSS